MRRSTVPYEKSVAFLFPHLAKEHQGPGDIASIACKSSLRQNWKCSECGYQWSAIVASRTLGAGCPKCAKYGHDKTKLSIFYLIARHPGQYKIGITHADSTRLKHHGFYGWYVLEKMAMEGELVRVLETGVKRLLKKKGVLTGSKAFREKFDGWTEAWNAVDLDVTSIDDLLEKLGTSFEAILAA